MASSSTPTPGVLVASSSTSTSTRPAAISSLSTPILESRTDYGATSTTITTALQNGLRNPTSPSVSGLKSKSDPTSLDALLSRWTSAVAEKMRTARSRRRRALKARKRAQQGSSVVGIVDSVFEPVAGSSSGHLLDVPFAVPSSSASIRTLDHGPPTSITEFATQVAGVREAIGHPTKPLHPKLNKSGSSGSYFCKGYFREGEGEEAKEHVELVGIFKPKDEEPYGAMNPKWTKWAHRVLLAPIIGGFGRSCLIPNLSYLSEAGASLLDRRLQSYIVPRTEVVDISSPSFFYHWLDRQASSRKRKPKALPEKPGSLQLFCKGFEDASTVLRTHPWPGRAISDTLDPEPHRHGHRRPFSLYRFVCGNRSDFEDDETDESDIHWEGREVGGWCWTRELMDDFRIEMEKLIILDFLMRNTDRGLDPCVSTPPSSRVEGLHLGMAVPPGLAYWATFFAANSGPLFAAAFVAQVVGGDDFGAPTAFATDKDFNEKMFEKQMALIKGQGYNIVQSLTHEDEGPLELCRRQKALVWDDPIEMIDDSVTQRLVQAASTPCKNVRGEPWSPKAHSDSATLSPPPPSDVPTPTFPSHMIESSASYGTRPMQAPKFRRMVSARSQEIPRPLPVSRGLRGMQGDFSGARGIDVMHHMEAVQAQEEDFSRSLGLAGFLLPAEEEDEDDSPWGSMSEGDLRTRRNRSGSKGKVAWRERVRDRLGGTWKKSGSKAKQPGHRRTESSNDASQLLLDHGREEDEEVDDDNMDALSEGEARGKWASFDGGRPGGALGLLKEIEEDDEASLLMDEEADGEETVVVVKERLEFVNDRATFSC